MSIAARCDECGAQLRVRPELAGKAVRCKTCGAKVAVPADAAASQSREGPALAEDDVLDASPRPAPGRRPRAASRTASSTSGAAEGFRSLFRGSLTGARLLAFVVTFTLFSSVAGYLGGFASPIFLLLVLLPIPVALLTIPVGMIWGMVLMATDDSDMAQRIELNYFSKLLKFFLWRNQVVRRPLGLMAGGVLSLPITVVAFLLFGLTHGGPGSFVSETPTEQLMAAIESHRKQIEALPREQRDVPMMGQFPDVLSPARLPIEEGEDLTFDSFTFSRHGLITQWGPARVATIRVLLPEPTQQDADALKRWSPGISFLRPGETIATKQAATLALAPCCDLDALAQRITFGTVKKIVPEQRLILVEGDPQKLRMLGGMRGGPFPVFGGPPLR